MPNTAYSTYVESPRPVSGFKFFLLASRVHARPHATILTGCYATPAKCAKAGRKPLGFAVF